MFRKIKKIVIRIVATILKRLIEIYRKFKPIPPRIYFCYNQSIHHIYHSIFIAIELSNLQKKYEVVVLSTSREASDIIEEELFSIPNNVKFIKIKHPGYNKINFSINWFVLLCRLRMHKPKAVIVTDYFDNVFRQLLLKTFWVYVPHGLVNREFASDPHIKKYDLVILPGERDLEELQKRIGLLDRCVALGYSKLDYFYYHSVKPVKLFDDSKPVILYNPHFEKLLSSFFDKGPELLQALSETNKYNIIFMPHPDLSRKYPELIDKTRKLPRLKVINRLKCNLDYMAGSDLYITDVSSSAFEWLYFNKPVIFFNTKKIDWEKSRYYLSWVCGRVVKDIPEMLEAIDYALMHPEEFEKQRKEMFNKTFLNQDKNVSKIIAQTVWMKLKDVGNRSQFFFSGGLNRKTGLSHGALYLAKKLREDTEIHLICKDTDSLDLSNLENRITRINIYPIKRFLYFTPLRWSLKKMILAEWNLFDYLSSKYMDSSSPVYAHEGQALYIFRKAEKLGLKKNLIAYTPHIEFVWQIHQEEKEILGYDYEWLSLKLKNKILQEYAIADLIIVTSKFSYKTFLEKAVKESKLKLVSLNIDRDWFKRTKDKEDKVFRVLYVGRFTPEKGVHYLIKAFRELALPNSELLLFGGTATRQARRWLDRLINKQYNIEIKHGDPRSAYEQSSVLVHPALQDGFGFVVLEAVAYGLPVVITENTGAKDFIKHGENGFIIPIRDIEAIKEKIRYYYHRIQKDN